MNIPKIAVVSCIDYRLVNDIVDFMNSLGYNGQYDQIMIPGASLAMYDPVYQQSLLNSLDLAVNLHHITEIYLIDHMDCGYYTLKLGDNELQAHIESLTLARHALSTRYPHLIVHTYILNTEGNAIHVSHSLL